MGGNGEFKIERGVPRFPAHSRSRSSRKYPFSQMEVGDSFFVPFVGNANSSPQSNVLYSAKAWAVRAGMPWMFSTSKVDGGFRIWRIA